jgi:RHS repeat-associated protein
MDAGAGDAVISLDANGFLHISDIYGYWSSGHLYYSIRHISKPISSIYSAWPTSTETLYTGSADISIDGLTSSANPVYCYPLLWSEHTTPESVKFASLPLPFGTPGASSDPWNREGISPYGTYFSTIDDSIPIGSGQLYVTQNDISIPGRGGLDLGIGRIYQQPRYFYNLNSTPYGAGRFPFSSLGMYWSLNLPWMDGTFVSLTGGQRSLIQWGNNGKTNEFENHDGAHFIMRSVTKGSVSYIELILPSGLRYNFSSSAPYLLRSITDMKGYDPDATTFSLPYNCINISYDESNRITSMTDRGLTRSITFTYNASSLLTQITRPDGKNINFTYIKYGTNYYLRAASDPVGRTTLFVYNSTASYCLDSITYPTKGRTSYAYAKNSNSSTETYSWLVIKKTLKDNASGTISIQTTFDYKVVNGMVVFANRTDRNDTAIVQGNTEYVFQSVMRYSAIIKKGSTGNQISQTRTWYDCAGQPCRIDHFKGTSIEVNYSTYTDFDDWGNVIFSRDALGHEIYSSYLNTSTQNSFQGGDILTRTSSGKIFYDSFDDWSFSDWSRDVSAGHATIYGAGGDVNNAPAIHVHRTTSGNCMVYKDIGSQPGPYVYIQTTFNTSTNARSYILGLSGGNNGNIRIYFWADNGNFQYYTGSTIVTVAPCNLNTKYEVGLYASYNANTYSIAIDGVFKTTSAPLLFSGNLDTIRFQAGGSAPAQIWFDNVRVYKSQIVTINNFPYGYLAELSEINGNVLVRSKTGTLALSDSQLSKFPPAFIKISKLGYYSGDIWGGDTYSMSAGVSVSSTPKTYNGFASSQGQRIADDEAPPGSTWDNGTYYGSVNDCTWVSSAGDTVSGTSYHASSYRIPEAEYNYNASHYHGFTGATTGLTVSTSRTINQYIWIEDGKVPYEIMIQFFVTSDNTWRRAIWGPYGQDYVNIGYTPSVKGWIGGVPSITGRWIELTVHPLDIGITSSTTITGIMWGLYGGAARWDYTSIDVTGNQLVVNGLTEGQTVKLKMDNGAVLTQTASSSSVVFDLYQQSVGTGTRVFPRSGTFTISNGGTTQYVSPTISEIWMRDEFTYSAPNFYPNSIKGFLHDRMVGIFQYQDVEQSISQQSFQKYDFEGNAIESKSKLGSSWVYSQASYDQYGNRLWSSDPTGRRAIAEYSSSNSYTYPVSTSSGGRTDIFEFDTSWTADKSGSSSTSWFDVKYSTTRSYSPTHSIRLNFSNGPQGDDACSAVMYKDYQVNQVTTLSVRMYLDTYSHNGNRPDRMASGIRMRLYDADEVNYATYEYWLACWKGSADNWSTIDETVKVIYGKPTMGAWINPVLHPSSDWDIDWSGCDKVRFELFVDASGAYGDSFVVYYDDFTYGDFASNSKTTYSYNKYTGDLLSSTDPLGHTASTQYDKLGRAIRQNNSDGTYRNASYDDTNNKITLRDELGHKTIKYFDAIGRLIKTERYNGSTCYSSVNFTYNWQDNIFTSQDAIGRITKTTYDYLGRPVKMINPDNTNRTISYNDQANLVTFTDENGHKAVQLLDDLGRLNATREYYTTSSYYETKMAYDAVGNLLTVKASNGNVTRMSYDSLDRVTQTTYPDNLNELMTYDEAGRALTKTNRNGQTAYSYYDSSGKLFRIKTLNDTISYLFDADGKTVKIKNSLATIYCFYNGRDLMSSMAENIVSNHTISYTYDAEGKLMNITYPNSIKVTYGYDVFDRVIKIDKNASTRLLTVYYNLDDTVSRESTGSVQVTNYTYNARGFVSQIQTKNGSKFVLSMNYTYDKVGNVGNISYTPTSYENYTYDWLNRLTQAKGVGASTWGSTIKYGYDSMGNRLWKNENSVNTSYVYGAYNKLAWNITSGVNTTWKYNGNGALTWRNTTSPQYQYAFNSMDQLTNVYRWTGSTRSLVGSYYYDGNGARAKTVEGSRTTEYMYSGHDPICDRFNGTYTDYVYLNGRMKMKLIGSDTYWYIDDALGSTRLVYKGSVKVYSVTTYKPFGTAYGASGTEKFTYAGEMKDSTGLFYLSARYYDPSIGRFVSMDLILGRPEKPQTMNRYSYCTNNPLIFTDPTGRYMTSGVAGEDRYSYWCGEWHNIGPDYHEGAAEGLDGSSLASIDYQLALPPGPPAPLMLPAPAPVPMLPAPAAYNWGWLAGLASLGAGIGISFLFDNLFRSFGIYDEYNGEMV